MPRAPGPWARAEAPRAVRLWLLLPGERRWLRKRDFEPEAVEPFDED